jgi:hypothetical protein
MRAFDHLSTRGRPPKMVHSVARTALESFRLVVEGKGNERSSVRTRPACVMRVTTWSGDAPSPRNRWNGAMSPTGLIDKEQES